MTTIEDIKKISEAGCIEDPAKVAAIVDEFANTSMGPIFACVRRDLRDLFDCIARLYDLQPEVIDELSYIELISMIDDLDEVMEPDPDMTPDQFKRFHINFLKYVLLEAQKSNLLTKSFLGISTDAMRKFMESRHRDNLADDCFNFMIADYEKMIDRMSPQWVEDNSPASSTGKIRERNIGDLLRLTTKVCGRSWNCWTDIYGYQTLLLEACSIDRNILSTSFVTAYREKADVNDLPEKYSAFLMFTDVELDDYYPDEYDVEN